MLILYFICSSVFTLAYVMLIAFYLKGWMKMSTQITRLDKLPKHKISVIISARNEASNIEKCLESIVQQNFPADCYELIVVDDFSTDDTLSLALKYKNTNVKIVSLADFLNKNHQNIPNKKQAISIAVQQAKYELIVTGDADCVYGENWLLSFEQYYRKSQKKFITAPVAYFAKNNLANRFLQMDLSSMIGITAGSIAQDKPVMANGANLLFEKAAFIAVNGYKGNEHIASGDDVFLLEKIDNEFPNSIGFLKNYSSIALTKTPHTFGQFVNQRIRWTSKSRKLTDFRTQLILVFNYLFCLLTFCSLFIFPIFYTYTLGIGLLMLVFKLFIDIIFFGNILSFFGKKSLLKWILPLEILHLIYVSFLGILSLIGSYTWKGRKV